MKLSAIILGVCLSSSTALASDYNDFLRALNMVEAGGKHENVKDGDNHAAVGPYQIHYKYWQDAVNYDKSIGGSYEDCRNYNYSLRVVSAYLQKYGKQFLADNNWEALARIHNGGPRGYKHDATLGYWAKVKKYLKN